MAADIRVAGAPLQTKAQPAEPAVAKPTIQTPADAQAQGFVNCAPKTPTEQDLFDMQVRTERGAVLNGVYKYPSNDVLEDQKKAYQAARAKLAQATRPYLDKISLDTRKAGFSWQTAVAGGELADLSYMPEAQVREQAAKWGFKDVQWFDKSTPLRSFKDLFYARDVQAFVAASPDAIAVSFRGTEGNSIKDILTDLAALFPLDMQSKAFPSGLTPDAEKRLIDALTKRLGPEYVAQLRAGVQNNERLTPDQLNKLVAVLPEVSAEAMGDEAKGPVVRDAIHRGFKQSKDLVSKDIQASVLTRWEEDLSAGRPLRPVYLFGHSMGGALATLFGYDLLSATEQIGALAKSLGLKNLSNLVKPGFELPLGGVYTYEAPRSIKASAIDAVEKQSKTFDPKAHIYNFVREGDPVPKVPSWGSWAHLGNTIYLNSTLGRLENCPDPRFEVLFNPSKDRIKQLQKNELNNWFDSTKPAGVNAHFMAGVRELLGDAAGKAEQGVVFEGSIK